jgi:hypothetical protein
MLTILVFCPFQSLMGIFKAVLAFFTLPMIPAEIFQLGFYYDI